MSKKKMSPRRLLSSMLGAATVALALLAAPQGANALTKADVPSDAIRPVQDEATARAQLGYGVRITLEAGKSYALSGDITACGYKVNGGTESNPTKIYITNENGVLTDKRGAAYARKELFVLNGGYVEIFGANGPDTQVVCNGKPFISDDVEGPGIYSYLSKKKSVNAKLNLKMSDVRLLGEKASSATFAIGLFGTMAEGETVSFTNVDVVGWTLEAENSKDKMFYDASPGPVIVRNAAEGGGCAPSVMFDGCEFSNNVGNCTGALSVVGLDKRPQVTLADCSFTNNRQASYLCGTKDYIYDENHVHSGAVSVKNANVALSGCTIKQGRLTDGWYGPCAFASWNEPVLPMVGCVAVQAGGSCTLKDTTIEDVASMKAYGDSYAKYDELHKAIYVHKGGTLTLAGKVEVNNGNTAGVGKALYVELSQDEDATGGRVNVDASFAYGSKIDLWFDESPFNTDTATGGSRDNYNTSIELGTCGYTTESDKSALAYRLQICGNPDGDIAYEVVDGKMSLIHRQHAHRWWFSEKTISNSYKEYGDYIAVGCEENALRDFCPYAESGDTIALMSSDISKDLVFDYVGKPYEAVLVGSKPSDPNSVLAQRVLMLSGAKYYRCENADDTAGTLMAEGAVPTDAGFYRVVADADSSRSYFCTLERSFQIKGIALSKCTIKVTNAESAKNGLPAFEWTGTKVTPKFKLTATVDGKTVELVEGTDYKLDTDRSESYGVDAGTYATRFNGMGNFSGTVLVKWVIDGTQFENVQAKGFDGTYDGKVHAPSVTVDNAPEGMQIEYSVDGGLLYQDLIPSYIDVTRDIFGNVCAKTIKYRIKAPDYVPVEGELEIKIAPADQAAPKDVKTTAATGHGLADGSIDGVDSAYEWKAEGADDYQRIDEGDTSVKGLAAGKYSVRLKADDNHYVSEALTVEVADGPPRPDGTGWKHDDAEHWEMCTCGNEKLNVAAHDFEWITDKAPTAGKPGSKHEECKTCGYKRAAVEIPAFSVKGYEGVYDGAYHGVTVDDLAEGYTVLFDTGSGFTSTAPTFKDACDMTVWYRVEEPGKDGYVAAGYVKVKISPRPLTVTAKDASKVYGESDPASFGYKVTKGELVEGEGLTGIDVAREGGEDVNKDGYPIMLLLSVGANPNYSITFKDGTFTIEKRELGVSWGGTEFAYDGNSKCPEASLSNIVGRDDVTPKVEGATKKAGRHTATITGIEGSKAGNYKLPKSGLTCDFTIKKAPQGAPVVQPVAETVSGKSDGKIAGVTSAMEWRAGDEGEYRPVGDATELTGLAAGAYSVRYAATDNHDASAATEVTVAAGRKLAVTLPSEQTGYTLKADATKLGWQGNVTLTFELANTHHKTGAFAVKVNGSPVVLNENGRVTIAAESDLLVTVEGVEAHAPVSAEWASDANAHWHTCNCGVDLDKTAHTFEWVIDQKPTATASGSKHQECTVCHYALDAVEIPAASIGGYTGEYDGDYHTVDTSNLPQGAVAEYSTDGGKTWAADAPKIKDVDSLKVAYKVSLDGTTVEGEVVLEVTPRKVTVAAKSAQKVYGEADPELGYEVTSGLVKGESLDGISVKREAGEAVREGGYAITVSQKKDANPNYDVVCETGVFTIGQRLLTVTWGTSEFVYDGKEHCPEATLGNVIGDDDLGATVEGSQTEAGASYTATLTALTGRAAGNYALPTEGLTCEFSITNAAQDAPKVQAEAETVSGKHDGKITGVDAAMEWRAGSTGDFKAVDEGAIELKNLAPGTYQVRYTAKANHDASAVTEMTVAAGRKLTVTLPSEQVGYTLTASATELDWKANATLTFQLADGYFAGPDFAVKVNGKKVELADGSYELKNVETDVNVTVEGVLAHEADGTGWKSDETSHWYDCVCGNEKLDVAEHDFEVVVDKAPTATAPGLGHEVCRVCGAAGKTDVAIPMLDLKIIEGEGQRLTVGAGRDLSVRSNAPFDAFVGVKVNGADVDPGSYDAREGSTIVTLHRDYLATLAVGEHTLSVVSLRDGVNAEAQTSFTIEAAPQPEGPVTPGAAGGSTTTTTTTTTTTVKKTGAKAKAAKGVLPNSGDSAMVLVAFSLLAGIAALVLALLAKRRA